MSDVKPSELIKEQFERATAYTNVIIGVGYAGFFALWVLVKDEIAPRAYAIAGLSIMLSLIAFIGWEVYQVFVRSSALTKAVKEGEHLTVDKYNDINTKVATAISKYWPIAFTLTVVFALIATGALLCVLVKRLLNAF